MLVQHYSLLPLQESCQVIQACFVNTKCFTDSHIAADQQMEWIVKINKTHIKHMYSYKTKGNLERRLSALPGIHRIAENFDRTAGVTIRSKRHAKKDAAGDELTMIHDLNNIRPFQHVPGRRLRSLDNIPICMTRLLDVIAFRRWFEKHRNNFTS